MSRFDGDRDEMGAMHLSDERADALVEGIRPDDPYWEALSDVLDSIRHEGRRELPEGLVESHVPLLAAAAAVSPRPEPTPVAPTKRTRRQIVFDTLLSSLLIKVMAATMAVAAAGAAVGVAANGAAPGDPLYGLDRAMESVGVGNGGAAERLQEAQDLVNVDLPTAVSTAAEAAADTPSTDASHDRAVSALMDASARLATQTEGEQSAVTREQVAALLDEVATQLQNQDGFDGRAVAEQAKQIRPDVPATPEPPVDVPVGNDQVTVPTTVPDGVPPTGVPPVDTPPTSTPPVTAPPVVTPAP